jgi:hypothetical protein
VGLNNKTAILLLLIVGLIPCSAFAASYAGCNPDSAADCLEIFNRDPSHVWNRTHHCLFARKAATGEEFGGGALDPLLWIDTQHLLTGDSHRQVTECLDAFLRTHAEQQVTDPVKRAIFQRDIWALFDWSARAGDHSKERRELQVRLAQILRRVALKATEIRALPDTYAEAVTSKLFADAYDVASPGRPFLPPNLFDPNGPWVCLRAAPTAIRHLEAFSGRSRFLVFIRLPEGRKATFEYLQKLWLFNERLVFHDADGTEKLNLHVPQFPVGTEVALVRQLILFDREGNLIPTSITESVQIRVYHSITTGSPFVNYLNGPASHDQDFFEFRLDKLKLFAGEAGGLVPVSPDEKEFPVFASHGDPFKRSGNVMERRITVLKSCRGCHADAGIHSVQSRTHLVGPNVMPSDEPETPGYGGIDLETNGTLFWKGGQYDWGLLNGYWQAVSDQK